MTDFGRDTSCTTSLRTGRFVSGPRLVGEALYRRLTTPRLMLRGGEKERDFGKDLSELVGKVQTKGDAASLPGQINAECTKDERVTKVTTKVFETTDTNGAKAFDVFIDGETAEGPFSLTLLATELSVELVGLTPDE